MADRNKAVGLTDEQIITGLRRRDPRITRDFFYTACRIAYHIYDKRYQLEQKPGLDFYSIAHEYYLALDKHHFRQLEDRQPALLAPNEIYAFHQKSNAHPAYGLL